MTSPSIQRLDPVLLAKLAGMELRARRVVEGVMAGRHRSRSVGHSLEFAGHRPYTPSDEWRHIDWKVFAKTDRWTVRERQEETDLRATLLLDVSRSMSFAGEGRLAKLRYAAILCAALSYLLVHRRESVGLGFFSEGLVHLVPARGGAAHLSHLLELLENAVPRGKTDLRVSLDEAGARLPRRGLIFIVSDFLSDTGLLLSALRPLAARKHEIVAWQVLDPWEIDLSMSGDFVFNDLESGELLRADAGELRDSYRRRMEERLEAVRRSLHSLGIDHAVFPTSLPLDAGLSLFLERRLRSRAPVSTV